MNPGTSITEVLEILTFRSGFNTTVVIGGTALLGLAAGVVGVFALLRKRSLLADAVSHATLPGIAIAFLTAGLLGMEPRSLPVLLLGAAISGLAGTGAIHLIVHHSRLREDAAIGIVLSVFFGLGIVLLSYIQSEAATGSAGLNAFIYGQAATMRTADVLLMGAIAVVSIALPAVLHKELALACFNADFARVDGWPVARLDLVIVALIVLVTVAGLQAVGLLMVVALLIIPPAAARFWTERLWVLLVLSGFVGAASGYAGAAISAAFPNRPAGAVIVLTAGFFFAVSMFAAPRRGIAAALIRRARLRLRIVCDHVVEAMHDAGVDELARTDFADLIVNLGWSPRLVAPVRLVLAQQRLARPRPGGGLSLTEAGRARGRRVSRNHALWTRYLITHADIAPSHVDWSVDQVEHALSAELIARLEADLAANPAARPEPRAAKGASA